MEIIDVFQDSDCPHVVVWTKIGHVLYSWAARPNAESDYDVELVHRYQGEKLVATGMTDIAFAPENLQAIIEAVRKYRAPVPANG